MTFQVPAAWRNDIKLAVTRALQEDIGSGDITAELIPKTHMMNVQVITREAGIMCGRDWVNETFFQLDQNCNIEWLTQDGDAIKANDILFTAHGNARSLLSAERTALNFLQLLSGTATLASRYAKAIAHTPVKILDTRKTIPGFRTAQKYAVQCGGGNNHRIGLYDAFLIKENHIAAYGSIKNAVDTARKNHPDKLIEVETENLHEFNQALEAKAQRIMLDNFSLDDMREAVRINAGRSEIEASGNVSLETIAAIAETGVNFISSGAITKHCIALDLSMRFIDA